jgi:hypothetical protein
LFRLADRHIIRKLMVAHFPLDNKFRTPVVDIIPSSMDKQTLEESIFATWEQKPTRL